MPNPIMFRQSMIACAVVLLSLAAALVAGSPQGHSPQLTSATARELWRKGSDQILAGDFHSGITTLEQVQKIEPGHAQVEEVISWLRDALALSESRERLRERSYQHWVDEAREAAQKAREGIALDAPDEKAQPEEGAVTGSDVDDDDGEEEETYKWGLALRFGLLAMANSKDEDELRKLPWMKEIVDNVLLEIDRARSQNEWRDALALYSYLKDLYPKTEDYETGYDFCRKRAHLEYVYGPKSSWRTDLRGVGPEPISEILSQIDDKYQKEVSFQELCLRGLDQLLILAQADSLVDAFPQLGDPDLVEFFVARLNGLIRDKQRARGPVKTRDVRKTFARVLDANDDSLRLPKSVLVDEFVAGILDPLDDFTAVIWPAEVDEFNKHTRGEFVGVGIQITKSEGKPVRVESPLSDSPAYQAGIKPGDLITEVDGKSTVEFTVMQAVRTITGEPGTIVTLTIMDPITEESRKVPLKRSKIKIRTVRGHQRDVEKPTGWDFFIDPGNRIGYVRVSGFMEKTVKDLEAALDQLLSEGCRGLILDLRFNPGGLLTSARDMCDLFLGEDAEIVKTKGRSREDNAEIRARYPAAFSNLPLIVLVNEYSASASEIVAGALAGKKEACIVGERTFGKGSVQRLIPIADNQAYLKLTTAHYYVYDMDLDAEDPWYCLHREPRSEAWGVEPHVPVKVIPQEMSKILRLRRERDVLKGKDQSAIPREVLERREATTQPDRHLQEDEDPDTDPQLMTALNLLRIKMMSDQPWALAPRAGRTLTRADAKTGANAGVKDSIR